MAGGFDRSKFKPTEQAVIQKQQADFKKGGDRTYLSVEVGENVFRIFPYHPDGGGRSYAEAKSVAFLELEVPKRDQDGKLVEGQTELKYRPVFNARVHGGLPFDLGEKYMELAYKVAIPNLTGENDNGAEFKKLWGMVYGNMKAKEKGISYQDSWAVYAAKCIGVDASGTRLWSPVGDLDLKKSIKDGMQEKAAEQQNPDPFSDPNDGVAVVINRAEKAEKATDWYKVKLDMGKVAGVSYLVPISSPLTDEQLEAFMKLTPLYKRFVKSFKRSDLEKQLEGLQRFDRKLAERGYNLGIFNLQEFQDYIDQMLDLVPEESEQADPEEGVAHTPVEAKKEEVRQPAAQAQSTATRQVARPKAASAITTAPSAKEEVRVQTIAAPVDTKASARSAVLARLKK